MHMYAKNKFKKSIKLWKISFKERKYIGEVKEVRMMCYCMIFCTDRIHHSSLSFNLEIFLSWWKHCPYDTQNKLLAAQWVYMKYNLTDKETTHTHLCKTNVTRVAERQIHSDPHAFNIWPSWKWCVRASQHWKPQWGRGIRAANVGVLGVGVLK